MCAEFGSSLFKQPCSSGAHPLKSATGMDEAASAQQFQLLATRPQGVHKALLT
jgi:hypothetical protein